MKRNFGGRIILRDLMQNTVLFLFSLLISCNLFAENRKLLSVMIMLKPDFSTVAHNDRHNLGFTDNGELYVVAEYRPPGFYSTIYLTTADSISIDGKPVSPLKIYRPDRFLTEPVKIRWYVIEPVYPDSVYQNFIFPDKFARIDYRERELPAFRDKWSIVPPLEETGKLAYRGIMCGTIFLKVEMMYELDFCSTPGAESRFKLVDGRDYGGLNPEVFRVSRKGDFKNKILSNFMIFSNLPEIANPVSYTTSFTDHQTLAFIGGNLNSRLLSAAYFAGVSNIKTDDALIPEGNQYRLTEYYFRELQRESGFWVWKDGEKVLLRDDLFLPGDLIWGNGVWAVFWEDSSPYNYPDQFLGIDDQVLVYVEGQYKIMKMSDIYKDSIKLIRWKMRF